MPPMSPGAVHLPSLASRTGNRECAIKDEAIKAGRENGWHVRGVPQASGEKTARLEIITVRVPGFARSTN